MSLDDDDDVIQAAFFSRMASCGTPFSVSYPLSSSVGKKGNKRNGKKKEQLHFSSKICSSWHESWIQDIREK